MTRASDTARLLGAGATILDGTTISTADNTTQLTLTSTDADASSGPNILLKRDSASPADNDTVGRVKFVFDNDAGEETEAVRIDAFIPDVSDGTEDATFQELTMVGGTMRSRVEHSSTETVFNQDSIDLDFRVESDNLANAFFLEGSTGNIGIGTNAPTKNLTIQGTASTLRLEDNTSGRYADIENSDGRMILRSDPDGAVSGSRFVFEVDGSEITRIDSGHLFLNTTTERNSGNLSIDFDGTSQGSQGLNDTSSSNGSVFIGFLTGGTFRGSISNNNNGAVAYNTTSDYRLKENVSYSFDATTRLKQLKPARFNWIADSDNTAIDGFLAHEVSSIVPEAITGTKDEMKTTENVVLDVNENIIARGVTEDEWKAGKDTEWYDDNTSWKSTITQKHYQQIDQSKLVPLLVKTIQELEARITTLENA